jgi:hypothetical protein
MARLAWPLAWLASLAGAGPPCLPRFAHCELLGPGFWLQWTVHDGEGFIELGLTRAGEGYVALGIGEHKGMPAADILAVHHDDHGEWVATDRWAMAYVYPEEDALQFDGGTGDVELIGVETSDGFFTATVRRPLITCGVGDRSITRLEDEWGEHQHRVLYAYGDSPYLTKHEIAQRGGNTIDFFRPTDIPPDIDESEDISNVTLRYFDFTIPVDINRRSGYKNQYYCTYAAIPHEAQHSDFVGVRCSRAQASTATDSTLFTSV